MYLKNKRFCILLAAELFILLLILAGCFRQYELKYYFSGEDISSSSVPAGENITAYGSEMELLPGVYQVRVYTELSEGQSMSVTVKADASYFNALRTNTINIDSGNDYIDYNVYVADKVPAAYVECIFENADVSSLIELDVYRTPLGNRILFITVLLIFAVFDFMLLFRKGITDGKISTKQQIVFWVLMSAVFIAYFPYLTDYYILGYDGLFHLSRISSLKSSLADGALFPVRVQDTWLCGHGYATSLFYGDLFLYIPAFLMLMGLSVMSAVKLFTFIIILATAWISYFSINKCVKNEYAALFGSVVYLLAPYRIFNFYTRGAMGENLAMVFLPPVCCGMYLLYTGDVKAPEYKKYKWYLIWGISGVLESHLITTEMAVLFMAAICLVYIKKTFRRQTFIQLLEAVGITLVINAWFWIPLLYMMTADVYKVSVMTNTDMSRSGMLMSGLLKWLPNDGGAEIGLYDSGAANIGAGAYILLVIYAVRIICRGKGHTDNSKKTAFFAVLTLAALIMSTAYLPWNAMRSVPFIGYVINSFQFPFRFMIISCMAAAFFTAFFVKMIVEEPIEHNAVFMTAIYAAAAVVLFSTVFYVNDIAFNQTAYYIYNAENTGTKNVVGAEYLLYGTEASDYYYHEPVADEGLEWTGYEKSGTNIDIYLKNDTEDTLYIELPLIGYKGYACENKTDTYGKNDIAPYISDTGGEHGDLRIAVPSGYSGEITVSYKGFKLFHVAEAVSLIGLIALTVYKSGMINSIYAFRKRTHG